MADLDKRMADENRALKARVDAAEAKAKDVDRENKRLKAQQREMTVDANRQIATLNSMRDLAQGPENPYSADARETYERLKRTTLKDQGGMAYYYTEVPCFVNGRYYVGAKNSPAGDPSDYIVVMPAESDPSVQWEAVEVGGVDPKTGAPVLRPLGSGAKLEKMLSAQAAALSSQFVTNTELNEKKTADRAAAGKLGPGADAPPAPGSRPSDTQVG